MTCPSHPESGTDVAYKVKSLETTYQARYCQAR